MPLTKRDAWIHCVAAGHDYAKSHNIVQEAWLKYPDKKPAPAKTEAGEVRQLASFLKSKIGCGLNIARNQIKALKEIPYWTNERIKDAIATAQPGEAPWDWTKRVQAESKMRNTGPSVVDDFQRSAAEQAAKIARGE